MSEKKEPKYGVWRNFTKTELKELKEKKIGNAEKPLKINTDFKSAIKKVANKKKG